MAKSKSFTIEDLERKGFVADEKGNFSKESIDMKNFLMKGLVDLTTKAIDKSEIQLKKDKRPKAKMAKKNESKWGHITIQRKTVTKADFKPNTPEFIPYKLIGVDPVGYIYPIIPNDNKDGFTALIKPLSVNQAWQGKRFKTPKYKEYEADLFRLLLPMEIPEAPYEVYYKFGFSSKASDYDNCLKNTQDIIAKKYGFNDKLIKRAVIETDYVAKGKEYFEFRIKTLVKDNV